MSGAPQPSFERSDILRPILDHLAVNDAIVLHGLQQKVLGDLTARGHPLMSSAAAQLVFQALRDALTGRAEEILSYIRQVLDGAYVEDCENLDEGLKAELLRRLESFGDLASCELERSTQQIRSGLDAQFLPSPTAIHEHLNQLQPKLFAEIDLICAKLQDAQSPRVFLKKGEVFGANRALRSIFESARRSIDIIDTYFGPKVFDLLEVSSGSVEIRLISDKADSATKQAYQDFAQQLGRIQFRLCDLRDIHARYIIIDAKTVLHIGHSLKDLGKSDSGVDPGSPELIALFEELWSTATSV
jgi:hypothetical protein